MRKLIYIIIGLFALGSYAQGGPKVDVIKFRGEVTTTVRNTFDVPTGETWLIWNSTTDQLEIAGSDDVWTSASAGLVEGTNEVPTGVTFRQSALNSIEIMPDGAVGGTDYIRMKGGETPNEVYLYLTSNYATLENYSNADITATGDNAIITKRYFDAYAGGGSTLLAADNTWTGTSNTFEEGVILGDSGVNGGLMNIIGDPTGDTSQFVFYESTFTTPKAAFGYNTTPNNGIYLANASTGKYLILKNSTGELAYNGDIDITGDFKIGGVPLDPDADQTNTTNVTAAGALMDSEVDVDIKTLSLPASTTISSFGATLIDDAISSNARTTLGLGGLSTLSSVSVTNMSATGTKSSATVLHGDDTFKSVSSASITDGTILNADINASAAIAGTKIAFTPTGDIASTNMEAAVTEMYTEFGSQIGDNAANISTNADDISDIELAINTVPASAISFNNQTGNYTLLATDANDNKIVRLDYNDEDVTLPSGVFDEGQAIRIHYASTGAGDANILNSGGTSILGYTDGLTLSAYPSGVTLSRISSATGPEVYEVVDYYGTLADYVVSGCSPVTGQMFTTANAASDPHCNEANATTGMSSQSLTLTSDASVFDTGSYSLKGVATAAAGSYMNFPFTVVSGKTYTFTVRVQQTIGTTAMVHTTAGGTLVTGEPSFSAITSGWTTKSFVMTATGDGSVSVAVYAANSGSIGDTVYADNWSIVETP